MTERHMFHYHYEGRTYLIEIPADSQAEAEGRMAVLSGRAKYDGVIAMSIPADIPGAGLFVRAYVAFRNFWRRGAAGLLIAAFLLAMCDTAQAGLFARLRARVGRGCSCASCGCQLPNGVRVCPMRKGR